MSRLSPFFKERVMDKIQTHERMADLYRKATGEGFIIRKDPDCRGIVFTMPEDLRPADGGPTDPRFTTVADLMEHEGEMFDFLDASERMAAAVMSEASDIARHGEPPILPSINSLRAREGLPPLDSYSPLRDDQAGGRVCRGGQGRSGRDLVEDVKAILLVGGVILLAGLAVGVAAELLP